MSKHHNHKVNAVPIYEIDAPPASYPFSGTIPLTTLTPTVTIFTDCAIFNNGVLGHVVWGPATSINAVTDPNDSSLTLVSFLSTLGWAPGPPPGGIGKSSEHATVSDGDIIITVTVGTTTYQWPTIVASFAIDPEEAPGCQADVTDAPGT